ncbi:ABC transporter substrate-binding protein [Chitinasiproducens palmae]|uniref:NitT/TauT family transport system substrate-binding protein n=1 Tax=Chitinasiproducens palmae TaxID=1770053 RepID=A0A1H2PN43_9BURK|nr:ABC transporter substrate-binding protein [Chitinasiproducens palmae]SDV48042.1 NitT/TauT family transport system substrate-binding protein [Chitinasiproducens palmae]
MSLLSRALIAAAGFAFFTTGAHAAPTKLVYANVTDMSTLSQAPVVAAKTLGYYKQENLDVEFMGFKGTATMLPQLLADRIQIGYPNADTILQSLEPGRERLPVKFFYNSVRSSSWEFVVLDNSPAKTMKDLNGKRLGVGALTFGNVPLTKAEFKKLGIDMQLVPVGTGSAAFVALKTGQVDALNLFDTQDATFETQGEKIRRLEQLDEYKQLFSNGFITTDAMLRKNPEAIAGFGRAVAKATVFCDANPQACVKMFWKAYPQTKPSGDEAKALADSVTVLKSRLVRLNDFPAGQPKRWGEYDPQVWKNFVKALHDGGQLKTTDIKPEDIYTNALVPKFSDFDAAKVVAQAKAYK